MDYKIYPLGESAITFEFGNTISFQTNDFVVNLSNQIAQDNFEGFIECVPAYSSLTVFYDVFETHQNLEHFNSSYSYVKSFVEKTIKNLGVGKIKKARTVKIPVSFKKDFSLDLEFVAKTNNLEVTEVIEIFLSKTYRVFMLGFLPGFAYMGELDERIATPRKQNPRMKVPKGSVGIAGKQTGIYPLESPGGWQIIGRTEEDLFSAEKKQTTLLQSGDLVKFVKT